MISFEAPDIAPARGGLLSVVDPIKDFDNHAFFTGIEYESVLDVVPRFVPTDGSDKIFDELANENATPFDVYSGLDSPLLVSDGNESSRLTDSHTNGMSHATEQAVQTLLLNPVAVNLTPTPGTPVTDPRVVLGLLEQFAGSQYRGLPVIHANRFAVALFRDLEVDTSNWVIHTPQGTPVANGSGYGQTGPGGVVATATQAWVYVSGQVNIWQGPTEVRDGTDLEANRRLHLAETRFLANIEGPVGAVLLGI